MLKPQPPDYRFFLLALAPTVPCLFFGLVFVLQYDATPANVSLVFLMLLACVVNGYFIWIGHSDQLENQGNQYQKKYAEAISMLTSYTDELERLVLMVEPKINEQVAAAKLLTEQEIASLIRRFTEMQADLKMAAEMTSAHTESTEQDPEAHSNDLAVKLRQDIDTILEGLQFQDRVSQILALVQENLSALRETVEKIQQQGDERHRSMIKPQEFIEGIQARYDTVKLRTNGKTGGRTDNDFTLF